MESLFKREIYFQRLDYIDSIENFPNPNMNYSNTLDVKFTSLSLFIFGYRQNLRRKLSRLISK